MARIGAVIEPHRRDSRFHVALILAVVTGILLVGSHLFYLPLHQVYWGMYARVKPMVSGNSFIDASVPSGPTSTSTIDQLDPGASPLPKITTHNINTSGVPEVQGGLLQMMPTVEEEDWWLVPPQEHTWVLEGFDNSTIGAPSLTKDLVNKVGKLSGAKGRSGIVVVTWANYHYRDFVLNWVEHLNFTGCRSFLVGAMDDELLQVLIEKGIPSFAMSSNLTLEDFGWGSATFNKMGREKINLIQAFTRWGQDVIVSDVDTVWMRNPVPYMNKYPDADILTSSDHLSATTDDGGLERWPHAGSAANIGIMLFRPKAAPLVDEWVKILDADPKMWDQSAFNDLFLRGAQTTDRKDRLFKGYNGSLLIGILPVSLFCSGHTFFTQQMPLQMAAKPYVAHATFQFSGTPGKRNRFREHLLWSDPPAYYHHSQGFISVENNIPTSLLNRIDDARTDGSLAATEPHFALVNRQLATLRAEFGLATALSRAAVLPELWCGQDRWWAPHHGITPGSQLHLPYKCPADHVLDLESMTADFAEASHGPAIDWRESSFLDNPRAWQVKYSKLTVHTCGASDKAGCADGTTPARVVKHAVKLRMGLNDKEIALALMTIARDYKLIHFEDPVGLWGGFAEEEATRKFKRRMDQYGSLWCCVNAHPGHVWYDFFWDQMPHVDRHDRKIEGKWHPKTGP